MVSRDHGILACRFPISRSVNNIYARPLYQISRRCSIARTLGRAKHPCKKRGDVLNSRGEHGIPAIVSLNPLERITLINARDHTMSETHGLQVGATVPEFELETYDPVANDFGSISSQQLRDAGKWGVLFFYPADFTFV